MTNFQINRSVIRDVWTMFQREHGCSVDRMVCDPELRNEFLESARGTCGTNDEFTILWTAMNLRKAKSLDTFVEANARLDRDDSITTRRSTASVDSLESHASGDESP